MDEGRCRQLSRHCANAYAVTNVVCIKERVDPLHDPFVFVDVYIVMIVFICFFVLASSGVVLNVKVMGSHTSVGKRQSLLI